MKNSFLKSLYKKINLFLCQINIHIEREYTENTYMYKSCIVDHYTACCCGKNKKLLKSEAYE